MNKRKNSNTITCIAGIIIIILLLTTALAVITKGFSSFEKFEKPDNSTTQQPSDDSSGDDVPDGNNATLQNGDGISFFDDLEGAHLYMNISDSAIATLDNYVSNYSSENAIESAGTVLSLALFTSEDVTAEDLPGEISALYVFLCISDDGSYMIKIENDYEPVLLYDSEEGFDSNFVGSDGKVLIDSAYSGEHTVFYYVSSDSAWMDNIPLDRVSSEIFNILFTKQ